MKRIIYADNAATTKLDDAAFEAMIPWLKEEYGNASQPYSFARNPKKALAEARELIASDINSSPDEIYFTSGGTESDNWAIKGTILSVEKEKSVITSEIEHHAVLNACKALATVGYKVDYLVPDETGMIKPQILEKAISSNTRLVSVMLSNNEIGTIEPIKELAEKAHKYDALFHTDAVQAVGHMPIDVKDLEIDMLSASAHKFNGPKGVGFLYIKKGVEIKPLNDGGAQEYGLRAGTENIAGIVGMAYALHNNCIHMEENTQHIQLLENSLLEQIKDLDYIRNGAEKHMPGNINISFKNIDGEALLHRMDFKGICVSTGSACDSVNPQISHVIRAIKAPYDYAYGTIRISLGKSNTLDEVNQIASALLEIVKASQK